MEKADESGSGIKVSQGVAALTLKMEKVNVTGFEFGIYTDLPKDNSLERTLQLTDCVFENNLQKAIYVESLTSSSIKNCQFINCGTKVEDAAHDMATAVDINLKYGDYEKITIEGCIFENCGAGLGGALLIKARDDGNYANTPATLDGVTIDNCTFTDNNRDIVFGEPMKNNAGPTGVTINGEEVEPSTGVQPGQQEIGGATVLDYRVAEGNTGLAFVGNTVGVVVDENEDSLTFDEATFEEAVADFFCADCVADPGSDHAEHKPFAKVSGDEIELVQAEDGRMPYFRLDQADLEGKTYTISYDVTVTYTEEEGGEFSVNTGNTNYDSDAHYVLKQGEGLFNFNPSKEVSTADAFKKGGKFHVEATYTLDTDGTPVTELTTTAEDETEATITGKGGQNKGSIYWCGYTYENVEAIVSNFTLSWK